jgi:hypothetical protein
MNTTTSLGSPAANGHASSSRQRKLACTECGFICYASAGAVRRSGYPLCACGRALTFALRYLAQLDGQLALA